MDFNVSGIGAGGSLPTPPRIGRSGAGFDRALDAAESRRSEAIPPAPPADVVEEMSKAAQVWKELRDNDRELHFEIDPDTKRVRIEVRDLEGNVLRRIPPSEALDVIGGAPLNF